MNGNGEFTDWGGQGLPGAADVTDTGSGADPYAFDPSTMDAGEGYDPGSSDMYADTDPTGGVLSGGLIGTGDSMLPALVSRASHTILGKPGGYALYQEDGSSLPNLGTVPTVKARGQNGGSSAQTAGAIVRQVRDATGLRVTARAIVGLIVKYGFQAAAALTKLDGQSLLWLFMRAKGVRHHRRGPGLYTISRRLAAADRLRHTVARVLGRGGYHRHRRRAPYHHFQRRRRHAGRK